MTIGKRIFLALTAVSLLVLTLNAVITRWNFQRGFLEYVDEQELNTIGDAAERLAAVFREEGGWERLRREPRRWNELLRESGGPPPGPRPSSRNARPAHPPDLGRRLSLIDAEGSVVAGKKGPADSRRTVPVIVDGTTVGYVGIAPRRSLTDRIDQEFATEQERSIYFSALAALVFAALVSALLARQLTAPIGSLTAGARAISNGDYDTRISELRDDELGELAREFNNLAATLEKNRVARRQWVTDIAHELRTPLAVLRGELDAIEDGIRTFDAASQRSLQDEVARLTRLVGELHELSVYDEGSQRYRFEDIDIVAVLDDFLAGAESRLADAGIELARQLPDRPVVVAGDLSKLERMFVNLLENTLRYTDAPGKLVVTLSEAEATVLVEFADSAPGVPDRALDRLFDRLFRIDASRSRDTGGSGLGLAICKAVAEAHGGRIEAEASGLGGISIRVHLPRSETGSGE